MSRQHSDGGSDSHAELEEGIHVDKKGLLYPHPPTGEVWKWKRGQMRIPCCPKAFGVESKCKLAWCSPCDTTYVKEASRSPKKKNKKNYVTGVGGGERGCCPCHTRADLPHLEGEETNQGYLKHKRTKKVKASDKDKLRELDNVATHCYFCGKKFGEQYNQIGSNGCCHLLTVFSCFTGFHIMGQLCQPWLGGWMCTLLCWLLMWLYSGLVLCLGVYARVGWAGVVCWFSVG